MDIDTLQALREHVVAQRAPNALLIIDAAIEDLTPEDDEGPLSEDGHECCECGRPEHLCTTFNGQSKRHGDA